jgi:hypothetical protein
MWPDRRHYLSIPALAIYCTLVFARWPGRDEGIRAFLDTPKIFFVGVIRSLLREVGADSVSQALVGSVYLAVFAGVVPWLVMGIIGRGRPHSLGFRRPNRLMWRLLAVSVIASIPFLVWMVRSPGFADQYQPLIDAGVASFLGFYAVNMFAEHFFLHGVVLAACRQGMVWPDDVGVVESSPSRLTRGLQWFGLAQPVNGAVGVTRVTRWLGLADRCVLVVLASGCLFFVVHIGKDSREMWLSLFGGFASAYLAYRCNSWLAPFALHVATAGIACLIMLFAAA